MRAPQPCLDLEALRRLQVLEVDAAEGRLERGDDVDEARRVARVDLQIEDVDVGELLEQAGLALHHRLAGQRPDVAEAEHGRAVGDDGDQVAARGVLPGHLRIGGDLQARLGDARASRRATDRAGVTSGLVGTTSSFPGRPLRW